MPPEGALVLAPPPGSREPGRRPLRVADVALFYGERSGGIRTYLDAKRQYARSSASFEHHLIVPGACPTEEGEDHSTLHTLPSVTVGRANGYRMPLGSKALLSTLAAVRPDVILLHDPFWRPRSVCRLARADGATVVMVHHGSAELDAAAWPGPQRLYVRGFRAWLRRAYAEADAVMAACDPAEDSGRTATVALRFGLHPAFRPQPASERESHVLYVGRLSREKGVFELLDATAASETPWRLRLIGNGPAEPFVRARARRLGIQERVELKPFQDDPYELAREYARASCVVMPGPVETFGLVAFEAAACGAPVVACATAPSARLIGAKAQTFASGDVEGLGRAVERSRHSERDLAWAREFTRRNSWTSAFAAELRTLEALVRR